MAIHKGIPVAGGLAGGSADGAATLVALDRLWDLRTPDDDLLPLAAELGSDVPFALIGGTAHGAGRGELVEPVEDRGSYWWVVVTDDEGLSTPAVYREHDRLHPDLPAGRHVHRPDRRGGGARKGRTRPRWPPGCATTCRRRPSRCARSCASGSSWSSTTGTTR